MSDGNDFERFLDAARAEAASLGTRGDDAKRIEASLGAQVSLRRRVPPAISSALAAMASGTPAAAPPKSGGIARTSWVKAVAILAPVFGLSLASYTFTRSYAPAVAGSAPTMSTAAPSTFATHEPAASSAPPRVAPAELPDAKEPLEAKAVLPSPDAHRTKSPAAQSHGGSSDSTLDAELALLAEATSALQTNRPARALALVDEHDRRFGAGTFAPEFAAQRVIALAALGRRSEACAQSASFLSRYPKSSLVPQVRSSCVDESSNR